MIRSALLSLVAVCALVAPTFGQCSTITTPLLGGNAQNGNMFDVVDLTGSGVDIQGVEVSSNLLNATATTVEVYFRTTGGSFVGSEAIPLNWTLHESIPVTLNPAPGLTSVLFSSPLSIPPGGAPFGLYVTVADPAVTVLYTNGTAVGTTLANDGTLEIREGSGIAYPFAGTFTPRNFNGSLIYSVPGLPSDYQSNSPALAINIDGALASVCGPAVTTDNVLSGQTGSANFNFASNIVGAGYDICISGAPVVPLSGAGISIGGGIVNINLGSPFSFLNGGVLPLLDPIPGGPLGATTINTTYGLNNIAPGTYSFQAFAVNGAAPGGISLSQASQYDVVVSTAMTTLPGPIADDQSVAIDVVAAQWSAAGIPMYGTTYNTIFIASNGRVNFNAADDDFTPLVATALTDNPFLGNWADLSPNVGGTITATATAGLFGEEITVSYNAVPYFGDTQTATFDVVFNQGSVSGVHGLSNLGGILPSTGATDQMCGISPGFPGGATDPGAAGFATFAGAAVSPTDMLYEFNDGTNLGSVQHAFIAGGITSVIFTPDGFGNYTWVSF